MRKIKLNTKAITDVLIAGVLVNNAPTLLNRFLFKSNPLDGMALTAAGAAVAYVGGMLLKKPGVANAGIAIAASEFVNNAVAGIVGGGPTLVATRGATPGTTMLNPKKNQTVNDFLRMSDYGGADRVGRHGFNSYNYLSQYN